MPRWLAAGSLLLAMSVPAAPLPAIQANGADTPQTLAAGTPLRITVNLQSADSAGTPADWWAVVYHPGFGWAHFDLRHGWLPGLASTYQGPLFDLPAFSLLDTRTLAVGAYQFYFGVDTSMNGLLDMPSASYARVDVTITPASSASRLQPTDFQYLGAFRLPGGETPPKTFAYGGNAMTFKPDTPATGSGDDAFPGSLFVMGHERIAYGDLPDGNQIAEISIPAPAIAAEVSRLPQGEFIQDFHDALTGRFTDMEEIPKVGMAYLDHPATGPKIHLTWGQHLQPDNAASQAWINPTLGNPDFQGAWFIGRQNLYSVNGYLFEIPTAWADAYAQSRYLASGRMRDGGQGGMGPALFAYRPWLADGSAPPAGARLAETPLLLYENAYNSEEIVRAMNGYQHPDEWEGGAWITTTSGKSALLFAGTKSNGAKYWYGYRNPRGPAYPCVDAQVTDFTTCRTAAGAACPAEDFAGCCDEAQGNCISYRGWWSTRADAWFILYAPADLAEVAAGRMEPWQPQPYASLDIDEHLYLNPPEWDVLVVGAGVQRRYRIGDLAYDRAHDLLYVLELLADGGKPVVHVWRVR